MFDHKREKINFDEIKMKSKYRRARVYVSLLTAIVPCHYADRADRDVQSSVVRVSGAALVTRTYYSYLQIIIPYKWEHKTNRTPK
jgi:hypothetical protein